MKKLQFIMLSALITAVSTNSTQTMWGNAEPVRAVEAPKSMVEAQKTNNAKTSEIATRTTALENQARQNVDISQQIKQQSQEAYNNSMSVKAVDAVTNAAKSASNTAANTWNWMTGKSSPTPTTATTGSIDLNLTKPRSSSEPTPKTESMDEFTARRKAERAAARTAQSTSTSRSASPSNEAIIKSTVDLTQSTQTQVNALDNSMFKKPAPKTGWFN